MLETLTERILFLPADARTDRPLLAAVLGEERVLMVDAGASPAHTRLFLDALWETTGRRPDWVVLTHWHWDHTFGLSAVAALSIGQHNLSTNLARLRGLSWDDAALARRVESGDETQFCAENIRKEYGDDRAIKVVLPALTFDEHITLDLGRMICDLHHVPTDHTDDAVAIYVREAGALFLGDALGENLYARPPYYSSGTLRQLAAFIDSFPAAWLVESHSGPARPEAFWRENRILVVIAELIEEGVTSRKGLLHAVPERASAYLSDDYEALIDLFLNGENRHRTEEENNA